MCISTKISAAKVHFFFEICKGLDKKALDGMRFCVQMVTSPILIAAILRLFVLNSYHSCSVSL